MPVLKSFISGEGIDTRAKAIDAFWAYHRQYNGVRRTDPEKTHKVMRVGKRGGAWVISYLVPSRLLRDIHERRAREAGEGGR